jgi:predicted phosphohydrolase
LNEITCKHFGCLEDFSVRGKRKQHSQDLKEEAAQSEDERLWLRFHPRNEKYAFARRLSASV